MNKVLSSEDLRLIGQVVQENIAPLDRKIDTVAKRLTRSISDLNQNHIEQRGRLRKDMEKLLSEHHNGLVEAITEVFYSGKLQTLEAEFRKVNDRLAALEASR